MAKKKIRKQEPKQGAHVKIYTMVIPVTETKEELIKKIGKN